ncbi:MAG: hypothetical protein K6U89_10730 [Chloroflexi bacterium]|nr:hypothetical protein [Chloroflexota bacterium]
MSACLPGGSASEPPIPAEAAAVVAAAKSQLAAEHGVDVSQVRLRSLEETTFPDTSLGCPEAGRFYLQVLTPGYIIRLELAGTVYEFHASRTTVVRCPGKEGGR